LGVARVINLIEVAQSARTDLHQAIGEALQRQAQRETQRVQLELKGGDVTLTGLAHSWKEREAVVRRRERDVGREERRQPPAD
jgi:osmotically-inducible protein OsmY